MKKFVLLLTAVLLIALLMAACGEGEKESTAATAAPTETKETVASAFDDVTEAEADKGELPFVSADSSNSQPTAEANGSSSSSGSSGSDHSSSGGGTSSVNGSSTGGSSAAGNDSSSGGNSSAGSGSSSNNENESQPEPTFSEDISSYIELHDNELPFVPA